METKANYVLIGAFTLAVIAGAFLFVLWFSGASKTAEHKTYKVVFTGSVSGLTRGSTVLFNGLNVGAVTSIDFLEKDPSKVAALIDVAGRTPVKTDTKARLESQGLTGVAAIALTGGEENAPALEPGPDGAPPVGQGGWRIGESGQAARRQQPRHHRHAEKRRFFFQGVGR
jgi:phospholipid/cholesterol/gamma-HCH transport system substrate-binding protein